MATTPWMTSNGLIATVKRKFAVPIAQNLLSEQDILAFANEEMMISQVPSILQFHEEYFVTRALIPLLQNTTQYPIPYRAIGSRTRDISWSDNNSNLFDMTRINPDDKAYFQRDAGTNNYIQKYYLENNNIVLSPANATNPTGSLYVTYFLRPNQLVTDDRAAITRAFSKQVTINNANISNGDTLTIGSLIFTAVSGSPSSLEFQIGATSAATATNLVSAINADATYSANNGNPSTNLVAIDFTNQATTTFTTSNVLNGIVISTGLGLKFTSIPSIFVGGETIDFLQTRPGHKTYSFDVVIPVNGVSGNYIYFSSGQIPTDYIVGDYICLANECIIPQIPTDLHIALAEKTGNRIMAAIGDQIGLQNSNQQLQAIEKGQGTIIDNRVDGSTQKITARQGLVSWGRMGIRRRL